MKHRRCAPEPGARPARCHNQTSVVRRDNGVVVGCPLQFARIPHPTRNHRIRIDLPAIHRAQGVLLGFEEAGAAGFGGLPVGLKGFRGPENRRAQVTQRDRGNPSSQSDHHQRKKYPANQAIAAMAPRSTAPFKRTNPWFRLVWHFDLPTSGGRLHGLWSETHCPAVRRAVALPITGR